MSRAASMDQLSEDESAMGSSRVRRRRYPMESQDSTASRDSMSRYTEPDGGCIMQHGRVFTRAERKHVYTLSSHAVIKISTH